MSTTITIMGNESVLESYFHPSLQLTEQYECALLYFSTTNSVPNINSSNNLFIYDDDFKQLEIPEGTYDLYDIQDYLSKNLIESSIMLMPNNNTLKCSLFCSKTVHFEKDNSIGQLLGFGKRILKANKWHESECLVNIPSLSMIRIECDLINGSYFNGLPCHVIHEFIPNTPPGYQYIEVPNNIIYFPINKNNLSSLTVRIVDENDRLIDFRKQLVQLRLHLRKSK